MSQAGCVETSRGGSSELTLRLCRAPAVRVFGEPAIQSKAAQVRWQVPHCDRALSESPQVACLPMLDAVMVETLGLRAIPLDDEDVSVLPSMPGAE